LTVYLGDRISLHRSLYYDLPAAGGKSQFAGFSHQMLAA
jgi:hypothetical protein